MATDEFSSRSTLSVGDRKLEIHRLDALQQQWDVERLPYTLRILLENVLRTGDPASRCVMPSPRMMPMMTSR